jgi:putative spermidine/putrescine transport system ATP-binding protein
MTVEQNVAFPLKMRGVDARTIRQSVAEALTLVGLQEMSRRAPAQLSGGQKQRVAFARAIVFRPKVLLMDEPLGALDLKLRERMQLEIVKYRKEVGCTVIYVTHDQGEALAMSDRLVVMDKGVAVQVGAPLDVYDDPKSLFVANFVGETNVLDLRRGADGRLSIGELDAALPPGFVTDKELLCIRPEKFIRLEQASVEQAGGLVKFEVTVVEAVFAGNELRVRGRARSGRELLLKESRGSGSGRRGAEIGQILHIGFHLGDAVLLNR